MSGPLKNKVIMITGGSRGIGREIALRCAKDHAHIVLCAKTVEDNPNLPGTIYSVQKEIEALGGKALALQVDVRFEDQIANAVAKAVEMFGGIDVLINNASAISLTPTLETEMKKFDLMFAVNVRATFACSKACIPYLLKADNPHILNLGPPLNLDNKWFKNHVAYTMSKYGMSMCTLGMAEEFKAQGIAVNSLWPKTAIATQAIQKNFPPQVMQGTRKPEIVADAAHAILQRSASHCSGNFFIDEQVLREEGISDFSHYALDPSVPLVKDFYVD